MSGQAKERRQIKLRWLILGGAIAFAFAAWTAIGVGYFLKPSLAAWAGLVTVGAISLELLMWTAAGVFGWSFLASRRATLARWRQRLLSRSER